MSLPGRRGKRKGIRQDSLLLCHLQCPEIVLGRTSRGHLIWFRQDQVLGALVSTEAGGLGHGCNLIFVPNVIFVPSAWHQSNCTPFRAFLG